MSNRIRSLVQKKITKHANAGLPILSHLTLKHDTKNNLFTLRLPLKTNTYDLRDNTEPIIHDPSHNALKKVSVATGNNRDSLMFAVDRNDFVKEILESNKNEISPPIVDDVNNKRIVVDFSSPNIAKPFHVGHLRSTIIGNYIANLNKFLRNNVTKLNYLGDWGTQVGLIKLGMDLNKVSNDAIKADPIVELYKVYVHANKLAEMDEKVMKQARDIFTKLENGDSDLVQQWEELKKYTIEELQKTYKRIGITFDEYSWESMYNFNKIKPLIDHLEAMNISKKDLDGKIVVPLRRNVPILKSDGSTLYMTRDIAAAIDRAEKYNFDMMYYVTDSGQFDHFINLFKLLEKMNYPWAKKLQHVKFGKIRGMSTRKGTALFLKDILDEACSAMKEQQLQTATTKIIPDENDNSSDILGISALIVHDLKQKRIRDYEFNWNSAVDMRGETGVRLQYTHCRLVSLEENCGATLAEECDPFVLQESIVNELVATISQFDEAIVSSYETLESYHLAKYLFRLSHTINRTLKELRVKGEPGHVASQRLLLYHVAKNVLNTGMKILGLMPLNKM